MREKKERERERERESTILLSNSVIINFSSDSVYLEYCIQLENRNAVREDLHLSFPLLDYFELSAVRRLGCSFLQLPYYQYVSLWNSYTC